jgi:hypothetical protein
VKDLPTECHQCTLMTSTRRHEDALGLSMAVLERALFAFCYVSIQTCITETTGSFLAAKFYATNAPPAGKRVMLLCALAPFFLGFARYAMRSCKRGAVDIDPISQCRRQPRPPLRPADRASHRHRKQKTATPGRRRRTAARTGSLARRASSPRGPDSRARRFPASLARPASHCSLLAEQAHHAARDSRAPRVALCNQPSSFSVETTVNQAWALIQAQASFSEANCPK